MRLPALLAAVAALIALASPAAARPLRVLYLDQSVGWRHAPVIRPEGGGLAPSETAVIAIGRESGAFTAEVTQDAREITPERTMRSTPWPSASSPVASTIVDDVSPGRSPIAWYDAPAGPPSR